LKIRSISNLILNKTQKICGNRQWGISFLYLSVIFLIALPEAIAWHNISQCFNFFSSLSVLIYLLVIFSILGLWYAISNSYGLAWLLAFVPISLLAQINYMKYANNSKPLFPWDILIVSEGLKAANSMSDPRATVMLILGILLAGLLAAIVIIPILPKFPLSLRKRIIIFTISLLAIISVEIGERTRIWSPKSDEAFIGSLDLKGEYYRKGFLVAFLNNIAVIPKIYVENYSKETINKIVDSLPIAKTSQSDNTFRPDIIIFVSESFFDITKLPFIKYSEPVNPYFQELKKQNYIKWFSPTFGGQTANAEFELITGFPLAFFSSQVVPYRLYCRQKVSSIASVLSSLAGYKTVMIHPYYRNFWSRDTVISNLGFDEFISLENMKHTDKKGGFVSDDSLVSEALDVLERENGPVFLYLMTIQNHYPFKAGRYDDYNDTIKVSSAKLNEEENGVLESYANGLFDSDRALRRLVEHIKKNSANPTLILFLGDHLPTLKGNQIYNKLGYELDDNKLSRYTVDGVVWSNYPVDVKNNANYQMCYLPMKVLEWAKQPMSVYFRFLEKLSEDYSVLHAKGIYDSNLNEVPVSDFFSSETARTARYLIYDLLFGKAYSIKSHENSTPVH
jgi:phosphoglycerol transferase MdoB-like AlkP superfamily enzyme